MVATKEMVATLLFLCYVQLLQPGEAVFNILLGIRCECCGDGEAGNGYA